MQKGPATHTPPPFALACGQCISFSPAVLARSYDSCRLDAGQIMLLAIFSLGCYFIAGALHCELGAISGSFLQYFFMLPFFVNVLQIYSICNLHDLSWGTKGLDSVEQEVSDAQQGAQTVEDLIARRKEAQARAARETADAAQLEDEFKAFRSRMVIFWLVCNGLVVALMGYYVNGQCFLTYLAFTVAGFNGLRLLGSILFIAQRSVRGAVTSKDHTLKTRANMSADDAENPNTVAYTLGQGNLKQPLMAAAR